MDRALCQQIGVDLFFSDNLDDPMRTEAKKACAACYVREQCLEYALAQPSIMGIFAGTSERDRQMIRRRQRNGKPTKAEGRFV